MRLKTGDNVVVIAGRDKGKTGKIMRILKEKNRVVVDKVNMRSKHVKKGANQPGQKIQFEASLHASNVMIIDANTKKRSRVGYKKLETGKKQRVFKKSGEEIKDAEKKVKTKAS